jgi:hypothetical protein
MPIAELTCLQCGEVVGALLADEGRGLRIRLADGVARAWSPQRRPRCGRCGGPIYAIDLMRAEVEGLDLNRLLFLRYLVLTGRLSDQVDSGTMEHDALQVA